MKIILADRGRGKSLEAIKLSAKTGATIICMNNNLIEHYEKTAYNMKLEIPKPVTYLKFLNGKQMDGAGIKSVIIDDLDCMLRTVFQLDRRGIYLDAITMNAQNVKMELES